MKDKDKLRQDVVALAGRGGKFPDRYDDGWNDAIAQVVSKIDAIPPEAPLSEHNPNHGY